MIVVESEKCCGCRACVQVCPKNAISTYYDKFGFERIKVEDSKCVNCNKCRTVCPILNTKRNADHLSCGSAYCKDLTQKFHGSSGGLFGVFAHSVLNDGGVVYGAAFDNKLHLRTTRVDSLSQLKGLYKSKYLLCDTTGAFSKIKKDLNKGLKVLYCSSPCQIMALKNFLRLEYENLYCIEFVCHGVGGQKQFNDCISYVEKKNRIKIKHFCFREKKSKASSHYYYYYYCDLKTGKMKKHSDIYMTFPYYYAYCDRMTCRESCYHCKFATEERIGDITIGDFHSISKYQPEIDRFAGVSMFVCNNVKGQYLFNKVNDKLVVKEYDWHTIFINNRFSGDEQQPSKMKHYLVDYSSQPYEKVVKKYFNYWCDWRYYYYHLPSFIRKLGNKLLRRE